MTANIKIIQLILIFLGLLLIVSTYFLYPKIRQVKLLETRKVEEDPLKIESNQINVFQSSQNNIQIESKIIKNNITKRLENLIENKQTNLTVSMDVKNQSDFFNILEPIADDVLMVKTHVDILDDFDPGFIEKLNQLSNEKDFVIFEDRKFADIGNTVHHQYKNGIYNIADWADTVTIHLIAGDGTIKGIFKDNSLIRKSQ